MDKRYTVFVSSTYADLKDERHGVMQAVMELDCIPSGMELFPATDDEQMAFIRSVIDDCDYYILIIGGRYGSVTAAGISYTECEYDYALEKALPILAFVHRNPGAIPFDKSEANPQVRNKLELFRRKVTDGRIVKFWESANELPALVTSALARAVKTHPAVGWVRGNLMANTEALSDLNELRKRNSYLEQQLQAMTPVLPSLADLDDEFKVTGTWSNPYAKGPIRRWHFTMKWGELFSAIAPRVLECPNDALMRLHFDSVLHVIHKKTYEYSNWSLDDEVFQTAKIQFMALKLVNVAMAGTTSGGQALFWSLTPAGEATLMRLRTEKKST